MNERVLVVVAHPDDEVLGLGGTLLRHIAEMDCVHVMILAEGITSRGETRDVEASREALTTLHENARRVAKFMGTKKLTFCQFPDNRMDSVPLLDIVKSIEKEVLDFAPSIVYTHHAGDVNVDHAITHNAVVTVCRTMPGQTVKRLLFFETLSSTEWQMATADKVFLPNCFVDIEKFIEKKIEALRFYESEMRDYPHSRSYEGIRNLARYRGLIVGKEYAEAFSVGRMVV